MAFRTSDNSTNSTNSPFSNWSNALTLNMILKLLRKPERRHPKDVPVAWNEVTLDFSLKHGVLIFKTAVLQVPQDVDVHHL
jgi:hypothetical protein